MSPMALRRQVGQLAFLGFQGSQIPPEVRSIAHEFAVGGVILFARNVECPEQIAELAFEAQRLVPDMPVWVGVDQEGGRVARLRRPFTEWPSMAALGRSGDRILARRFAEALGRELGAVGVSIDFAPVLDVLTNAHNPAIGDRALGSDAGAVADLGAEIIDALQAAGVAACGKHFPGHGDTSVDSHHDLPVVDHAPDRLDAIEYVPFRRAIDAGVAAIMVAHVLVPAYDEERPASVSPRIVSGVLRQELSFDNLIVTDDLSMKGCSARWAPPAAALMAVAAGADAVLLCEPNHDQQAQALEDLVHAIEDGTLSYQQVEASVARHQRLKSRFLDSDDRGLRPSSRWRQVVGCEAHAAIAAEMARYA